MSQGKTDPPPAQGDARVKAITLTHGNSADCGSCARPGPAKSLAKVGPFSSPVGPLPTPSVNKSDAAPAGLHRNGPPSPDITRPPQSLSPPTASKCQLSALSAVNCVHHGKP